MSKELPWTLRLLCASMRTRWDKLDYLDSQAYGHVVKAVSEKHWRINFYQVLGRQVALGEDEEAPEDLGAVGWLFIW